MDTDEKRHRLCPSVAKSRRAPLECGMTRREVLKAGGAALAAAVPLANAADAATATRVERWDVFELVLTGPKEGNPFLGTWVKATFRKGAREIAISGFYDG